MATRYTISQYFLVCLVCNLPFIVANLIFSRAGFLPHSCATDNISLDINMAMWMRMHAINQLIFIIGLMLASILRLCTSDAKDFLLACSSVLVLFNCLLQGLWLIIGSTVFWGGNDTHQCPGYF